MRGYPKQLKTKKDFYNCLALVQSGELSTDGLAGALEALDRRRYIACAVRKLSTDNKTATVMYCAEAAAGGAYKTDTGVSGSIKSVTHKITEDTETADTTAITLDSAAEGAAVLYVLNPADVLEELGMTEEDITAIKGVLAQYE